MILCVDAGNTMIKFALYDGDVKKAACRTLTKAEKTGDDLGFFILDFFRANGISPAETEGIIVSSVVPGVVGQMETACEQYLKKTPLFVSADIQTGLTIATDDPKEMGADRICAAAAAAEYYGCPVVIANFGTATCYDMVDSGRNFCAAVTSPGLRTSAESLWDKAALLGEVKIKAPGSFLSKNTTDSLQAGLVYGTVGQAEYIINGMKKEAGELAAKVVACGGYADIVAPLTRIIDHVDDDLVFKGLRLIYEKNGKH
ncbi:MAG: type III pantothenate kinase [Eubacteriaceae bacterium]|nr:type III pantothenate kinase [Eubacteriaceae bacterium]